MIFIGTKSMIWSDSKTGCNHFFHLNLSREWMTCFLDSFAYWDCKNLLTKPFPNADPKIEWLSLSLFGIKTSSCMTEKNLCQWKNERGPSESLRNYDMEQNFTRERGKSKHAWKKNWKPYMHGNKVKVLLGYIPN